MRTIVLMIIPALWGMFAKQKQKVRKKKKKKKKPVKTTTSWQVTLDLD